MMMLDRGLGGTGRLLPGEDRDKWEPLIPWGMLKAEPQGLAKKFGRRMHPEALSAMAELFLVNGDLSAWLYTGVGGGQGGHRAGGEGGGVSRTHPNSCTSTESTSCVPVSTAILA